MFAWKKYSKFLGPQTVYERFQFIYNTILSFCLDCRKDTDVKNTRFVKTNKTKLIIFSKWAVCDCKKSRFIEK